MRKELRRHLPGYLSGIRQLVRPVPWWCPAPVWRWIARRFFELDIYEND